MDYCLKQQTAVCPVCISWMAVCLCRASVNNSVLPSISSCDTWTPVLVAKFTKKREKKLFNLNQMEINESWVEEMSSVSGCVLYSLKGNLLEVEKGMGTNGHVCYSWKSGGNAISRLGTAGKEPWTWWGGVGSPSQLRPARGAYGFSTPWLGHPHPPTPNLWPAQDKLKRQVQFVSVSRNSIWAVGLLVKHLLLWQRQDQMVIRSYGGDAGKVFLW